MKLGIWAFGFSCVAMLGATGFTHQGQTEGLKEEKWSHIDQTQYCGSEKCVACHKAHYEGWKVCWVCLGLFRPTTEGSDKTVPADFSGENSIRKFALKDVKWVIGHRWKLRFIGEVNGQEVVFPAQWSVQEKKWQPYEGRNDWWYETHKDWKTRSNFKLCAGCHSTGSDHYAQKWVELNISCESCHGPGKTHSEKPKMDNIVNPARLSVQRSMDICLSCHQSGKPPGDEYAWPVGYQPGKDLAKYWKAFEPEANKRTSEFWENGSAHKNRVQGNTFLQSVMHGAGLQCTTCHESHGSRNRSMTIKSADTNALCMTCHGPEKSPGPKFKSLSDHTHHESLSAGSRCIECHMVKTGTNAVAGESRNHTFMFISPTETIKNVTPNSCNSCHSNKTSEWALESVKKWYPRLK